MEKRAISHLVTVDWLANELAGELGGGGDLRVVDCRWKLGQPGAGERAYLGGHIPGAVFADVDRDLSAPAGEGGRHPLPAVADFVALMGRLGIGDRTRVVAYDDQVGGTAARVWFLLRYFGHETGAILDGGLPAWVAAGQALQTEVAKVEPAEFHPRERPELLIPREKLLPEMKAGRLLLLDARALPRRD